MSRLLRFLLNFKTVNSLLQFGKANQKKNIHTQRERERVYVCVVQARDGNAFGNLYIYILCESNVCSIGCTYL